MSSVPIGENIVALKNLANEFIASGKYHEALTILKGFRNGAVYGAKIRFPHALVMTFLFRTGTFEDKMRQVLKATYQHSRNLACFVTVFKTSMLLLNKLKGKEHNIDAFICGALGGYIVFNEDNNVNNQIILYLFSRVSIGFVKLLWQNVLSKLLTFDSNVILESQKTGRPIPAPNKSFAVLATLMWACVMWLFRHHRQTLQSSLQASMQYLYNDSDLFNDIRTLLIHNR